jgi:hypothetical protein
MSLKPSKWEPKKSHSTRMINKLQKVIIRPAGIGMVLFDGFSFVLARSLIVPTTLTDAERRVFDFAAGWSASWHLFLRRE